MSIRFCLSEISGIKRLGGMIKSSITLEDRRLAHLMQQVIISSSSNNDYNFLLIY